VFTLEAKTEQDRRRVHVRSGLMHADRPCASGVSLRDNRRHHSQTPERIWRVSDFSGLQPRDPAAASQAFQTAMQGFDRLMKAGVEYWSTLVPRQILLPMVEQIDPALLPEYFWRILAMGRPAGNPRSYSPDNYASQLAKLLAWYDRDVAAALFEPLRDQMEQTDDRKLANSRLFAEWSLFDPRAAVARLEQVTIRLEPGGNGARELVAELLGLSHEERWRKIWSDSTEIGELFKRDLR
jgi:hypothetical protein